MSLFTTQQSQMNIRPFLLAFLAVVVCAQALDIEELPRVEYDVTYSAPTKKVTVSAGQSIQDAIDAAELGTVIELEAGATWNIGSVSLVLKNKTGAGWIYIQTSAYNSLPAPGTRVTPADSPKMPKIISDGIAAITVEPGAHHYRLVGLEITSTTKFVNALLEFGIYDPNAVPSDLSDHIVLDRIYAWSADEGEIKRGASINFNSGAVIDSYFAGFKAAGLDSQAIAGWIGTGPYVIDNNFLEGGTENFIMGGSDPQVSLNGPIPSDIYFRRNHIYKRPSWLGSDKLVVKNLFELKVGRRILVEGNVLENNWANGKKDPDLNSEKFSVGQVGRAIVLTPRNQDGTFPGAVVEDITLRNNILYSSCMGLVVLSEDNLQSSLNTQRIVFENNLLYNLTSKYCNGGDARGLVFVSGVSVPGTNWLFNHNTIIPETGSTFNSFASIGDAGIVVDGFQVTNNIGFLGDYSFHSSLGPGVKALENFATNWEMKNNVFIGSEGFVNFFPNDTIANNGSVLKDIQNNNFNLVDGSPYLGTASDGTDPGADLEKISCAINRNDAPANLVLPTCTTAPTSTVPSKSPNVSKSPKATISNSPQGSSPVIAVSIFALFIATLA